MPRLDYPLDSDTITSAIEDSGYPWHIDEGKEYPTNLLKNMTQKIQRHLPRSI